MKLKKILQFDFIIEMVSGMRIGGSGGEMEIGGADPNLTILRDPSTGEPYIPGSSLKGKLRTEAERRHGIWLRDNYKDRGKPCMCGKPECRVCPLFGAHMNTRSECAPTRILVRDARFTEAYGEKHQQRKDEGLDDVEYKTENIILRWEGVAKHPRTGERVLPGAQFQARVLVHIYDTDNAEMEQKYRETIEEALGQIEIGGAIGASGSRGYGEIRILEPKVKTLELSDLKVTFQAV